MSTIKHHGGGIIFISFIVAMGLAIIPLPDVIAQARPDFVSLAVIYWCMALPERVGLGTAWIAGLFIDVAYDTLLGQYALALTLTAFFVLQLHQRMRIFPLWQQSISVAIMILIQVALALWIKGIMGQKTDFWVALWPVLTTSLFWPPVFILMRYLRRYYQIS